MDSAVDGDVLDSTEAGARIVRGGAIRSGGYAAGVALSVLSAALLTRHLGVARFGEYTTVISLVTVVSTVTDAGMSNVGTHEYSVSEGAARDVLMRVLLGLRLALSFAGVALAVAFAAAAGYAPALFVGTLLAGLGTVALVWQHTFSIPLAASLRLGVISALELARQVLFVLMILGLILLGAGVLPLLAVTLVVNALLIAPTAVFARGRIPARPAVDRRAWVGLLRPTIAFSLATAVGTLYIYTAQIITSLVTSQHESGLFAVSFRVFVVVAAVPGLLASAALPVLSRAARDDHARLHYALQRMFEVSLILGVACVIAFTTGAPFVINVVAGKSYSGAAPVLRIQSLAMLASFVLAGWSFALLSLRRYRSLLLVNGAAFVVSCALTIPLASTDGAQGAAIATIGGEIVLALASLRALVRADPQLRPRAALLGKVLLAAVPAVLLGLLTNLPSVALASVSLVAYAVVILLTRAAPAELADLIPHVGRRNGR